MFQDSRGFKYLITEILLKIIHLTDFSLGKTLTQHHRFLQQNTMSKESKTANNGGKHEKMCAWGFLGDPLSQIHSSNQS